MSKSSKEFRSKDKKIKPIKTKGGKYQSNTAKSLDRDREK